MDDSNEGISRKIYLQGEKRHFSLSVTVYVPSSIRPIGWKLQKCSIRKLFLNSCSQTGRVKEDPYASISVTGKDTKKNLRSYPWQNKFTEEGTEAIPQGRDGPSQERSWLWKDEV